ncbi:MAG: 3-deoxy-D-manno-octulosonic acid transferase [Saprospiraceae bacterium]
MHLAARVHPKARLWVTGRWHWRQTLRQYWRPMPADRVLWVHAASLGEFEQGRPLIESFRAAFPDWKIVLTFFSPSGYLIRKNYPGADWVGYLPADTPENARDFLDILRPDFAVFIKYEFWANYLFALRNRNTPTLLISALFRPNQPFFRWYGGYWRRMLACYTHIFVQNEDSLRLLRQHGYQNNSLAGDTRIDRVLALSVSAPENPIAAAFAHRKEAYTLVAGSTWPPDEKILIPLLTNPAFADWRLILAPHTPSENYVQSLEKRLFDADPHLAVLRYSQASPERAADARVLIIDNIGLLNGLYRYGYAAYIGGGFGRGIHNTLEPAAFGLPVLFGPHFAKFEEARQMADSGGAFPCASAENIQEALKKLELPEYKKKAAEAVRQYLQQNKGATEMILSFTRRQIVRR